MNEHITSNGLIGLAQHCSSLQTLNLYVCRDFSDDGLIVLAQHCTSLTSLNVRGCNITDDSIIEVAKHRI